MVLQYCIKCCICIGTHDVQNINASSSLPGEIRVTGDLVYGSNASSVLVIVYNSTKVYYSFSPPPEHSIIMATLPGLFVGQYQVSVFVVEENGQVFHRSAVIPKNVTVSVEGIVFISYKLGQIEGLLGMHNLWLSKACSHNNQSDTTSYCMYS